MRWPFRRSEHAPSRAEAGGGAPVATAPSRAVAHAPMARREWSTLPPLLPTVEVMALIAPSRPFVEGTNGGRPLVLPRQMLPARPDLAPSPGLVEGLAVPYEFESDLEMTHMPRLGAADGGQTDASASSGVTATGPVVFEPLVPLLQTIAALPAPAVPTLVSSDLFLPPRPLAIGAAAASEDADQAQAAVVSAPPPSRSVRRQAGPPDTPLPREEPPADDAEAAPAEPARPVLPQVRRRPNVGQTRRTGIGPPVLIDAPADPSVHPEDDGGGRMRMPMDTLVPRPSVRPPVEPVIAVEPEAVEVVESAPPPRTPPLVPGRRSRLGPPLARPEPTQEPATRPGAPRAAPDRGRPAAGPVVEPIPPDLRDLVHRRTGVDVGDVVVHRDENAAREARELAARAFTRDGEVSLPHELGPFTDRDVRGLLAHELTHAAQQQEFGGALPLEHTPIGRRLEAQARKVEREARGDAEVQPAAPAPVPAPAPPPAEEPRYTGPTDFVIAEQAAAFRRATDELVALGGVRRPDGSIVFAAADSDDELEEFAPTARSAGAGVQRADEQPLGGIGPTFSSFVPAVEHGVVDTLSSLGRELDTAAEHQLAAGLNAVEALEQQAVQVGASMEHGVVSEFAPAARYVVTEGQSTMQGVEQHAAGLLGVDSLAPPAQSAPPPPAEAPIPVEQPEPGTTVAPQESQAPFEVDHELLYRQIYRRVRQQLKSDMLIERERSGSLANSH